jgi:hypothetical protein
VSTGDGLGIGLPGVRRLMDEFHIESKPGEGTTITMIKWCGNLRVPPVIISAAGPRRRRARPLSSRALDINGRSCRHTLRRIGIARCAHRR